MLEITECIYIPATQATTRKDVIVKRENSIGVKKREEPGEISLCQDLVGVLGRIIMCMVISSFLLNI